jgi:hypothetical protein
MFEMISTEMLRPIRTVISTLSTRIYAVAILQVPLPSQRKPRDQEMTPGPGAYVEGAGLAAKAAPLPTDLQFFGSAAKR